MSLALAVMLAVAPLCVHVKLSGCSGNSTGRKLELGFLAPLATSATRPCCGGIGGHTHQCPAPAGWREYAEGLPAILPVPAAARADSVETMPPLLARLCLAVTLGASAGLACTAHTPPPADPRTRRAPPPAAEG